MTDDVALDELEIALYLVLFCVFTGNASELDVVCVRRLGGQRRRGSEMGEVATFEVHVREHTLEPAGQPPVASTEAMWVAMLYLGLRPGEAAALAWSDVDFTNNVVHVRHGRKRHKGRITIGSTKTPGSVRSLDAPGKVIGLLSARRLDQKRERLAAGQIWRNDADLIFTNPVGSPTDPPKVRAEFNRVIDSAGIGLSWTPNMLRHSAASIMSDAGVPLERIADQLGHKDTRMLTAHYRQRIRPTIDAALILDGVL